MFPIDVKGMDVQKAVTVADILLSCFRIFKVYVYNMSLNNF